MTDNTHPGGENPAVAPSTPGAPTPPPPAAPVPAATPGQHDLPGYAPSPPAPGHTAMPSQPPAPGYAYPPGQSPAPGHTQAPQQSPAPGYAQAPGQGQSPYYSSAATGYPAAPNYGAPAAAAQPTNGLAVTAMICGIAGLALSAFVVPLLASIAAVILGHVALKQLKRTPGTGGRGMAIAGLILGYVGCAVVLLVVIGGIISALFFGFAFLPLFLY